jgi:hypothetical protein
LDRICDSDTIVGPMPPWTQNVCLSIIAASGRYVDVADDDKRRGKLEQCRLVSEDPLRVIADLGKSIFSSPMDLLQILVN